jgi:hypothetical protein
MSASDIKLLPLTIVRRMYEWTDEADVATASGIRSTTLPVGRIEPPNTDGFAMPELEKEAYIFSYDPRDSSETSLGDWERVGIPNPPSACCGSRHTTARLRRGCDGRAWTIHATDRSGSHDILKRGGVPGWSIGVVYRVVAHEAACVNRITYFDGDDARVVAKMPAPTQRKFPCSPAGMVGNTFVERGFELKSDQSIFCGGASISRQAQDESGTWEELLGEAQAGFATQTNQFFRQLELDCGDESPSYRRLRVHQNLVLSGSWAIRRLTYDYRRNFIGGRRFAPLVVPELAKASPAMVEKVLLVGGEKKVEIFRRKMATEAGHGSGVTGDHCNAIAAKTLLVGPDASVKKRQCFHLVDARRGNILGGYFVPGTAMEHLRPGFKEVGARNGVDYGEYYADNPPCGRSMIEDELHTTEMIMGTGHLARRFMASTNGGCNDSAEHGADVGHILRDKDDDVIQIIKALLVTPGGLLKGGKVMVKAATAGSRAVMRTWGNDDSVSSAVLDRMVQDGSFHKTSKNNIPPKVVPTPIKILRFKAHVLKWNPFKEGGGVVCSSCGRQSLYGSASQRCAKGCSCWTSATPNKAANFYETMVDFHNETTPLAIADSKDSRGLDIYETVVGENPGERAHLSIQRGMMNGRRGDL